jgi:hypothetical protein
LGSVYSTKHALLQIGSLWLFIGAWLWYLNTIPFSDRVRAWPQRPCIESRARHKIL